MSVTDKLNTQVHFGIVTRNVDPKLKEKARGAVYFKSDTLTGGTEYPEPAQPSFPLAGGKQEGFFYVPQVGDQIEVEICLADEHPVPKYIRMVYSDEDDIADEFKENYPFRMGWKTRNGHIFYFDVSDDKAEIKLKHTIGTFFSWDKDGNEIKEVVKDFMETIKGKVIREVMGQMSELFKAEVKREYKAKVTEQYKADLVQEILGQLKQTIKADWTATISGNATMKAKGNATVEATGQMVAKGTGGTDVGSGASPTNVLGSVVNLAGGGLPIARVGDQCIGVGNLGVPVISNIVAGSTKVTSA